jgi:hypothetical protein
MAATSDTLSQGGNGRDHPRRSEKPAIGRLSACRPTLCAVADRTALGDAVTPGGRRI